MEFVMHAFKTAVLATTLVALAGCSTWDNCAIFSGGPGVKFWPCGDGVPDKASSAMPAREDPEEKERQRLADELAAAQKQNSTLSSRVSVLERQLADRDREIASLRSGAGNSAKLASQLSSAQGDLNQSQQRAGDLERQLAASQVMVASLEQQLAGLRGELSTEMTKLKEAQRGLIRALRPQIEKGDITVDLNNERLLINLASGYLFGSGQDELKPAGADALKQVGTVLKDFPEYKVAVDGHTDNVPIQGALKKKFPSNKELSEGRAANAVKALTEGGLGAATTHGYADTKPVEPNTTASGRAKNRRVEVRVTK
jgi:chemotaxis protein MotB